MRRLLAVLAVACGCGGPDAASPDAGPPTFEAQFASADPRWDQRGQATARIDLGVDDAAAADGKVATLLYPGDPALASADRTSPAFATELATRDRFGFGRYEARVSLAGCAAGEEVVNGVFVYFNDGADENANGLVDNSEIDIEILCGEPTVVWLTSWTDYDLTSGERLRKKTRAIDLATGEALQTPDGMEDSYALAPIAPLPELIVPGFPGQAMWDLGFDWRPDGVRWFLRAGDRELTLWDMTDAALVPQRAAGIYVNLWHAGAHWWSDTAADYPAQDAVMTIDWVRHWAR